MPYLLQPYRIELSGGSVAVPVGPHAYAAVQVIPEYGSTTGVIEIKKSLTGEESDAVSFSAAVTPNMTTKAISDDIDVREVDYLHIVNTTADAGEYATVWVYATPGHADDRDAARDAAAGEIELEGGFYPTPIGVGDFTRASVQILPKYGSTTGVLEVKRSLSGQHADAVSFGTAVAPHMTSKAISEGIDIRDTPFLHIANTTADSGKRAGWYVSLGQTDRVASGGSGGGPFASPVEFAAGSVSSPGITFTTNTGSGFFHSTGGNETLSVAVDGELAYEAIHTGSATLGNFYGDTTTFSADTSTTLESPFVNLGPDSGGTRSQLRFKENSSNGSNYIALRPPTSISTNRTYTLPSDAQADGSLWVMNGSGLFSVTDPSELDFSSVPSGATQVAAGAAAGELWIDTSDGNAVKVGT